MTFTHRITFNDKGVYLARLITRHRTEEESIHTTESELLRSRGLIAWIWRTALTFKRDKADSLHRDILLGCARRLRNEHPVTIGVRHSFNGDPDQVIELPHKAAKLAGVIEKGQHFHFYIDWVPL
jgi:hypothetical protein